MLCVIISLITETDNNNWRENYKKNLAEELAMEFENELSEEVVLGDDTLVGKQMDRALVIASTCTYSRKC